MRSVFMAIAFSVLAACATPIVVLDEKEIASVQSGQTGIIAFSATSKIDDCMLLAGSLQPEDDYQSRQVRLAAQTASEGAQKASKDDESNLKLGIASTNGRDYGIINVEPGTYRFEPAICTGIISYSPTVVTRDQIIVTHKASFEPITVKGGDVIVLSQVEVRPADFIRDKEMVARYLENNPDKTAADAEQPLPGIVTQTLGKVDINRRTLDQNLGFSPQSVTPLVLELSDKTEKGTTQPAILIKTLNTPFDK